LVIFRYVINVHGRGTIDSVVDPRNECRTPRAPPFKNDWSNIKYIFYLNYIKLYTPLTQISKKCVIFKYCDNNVYKNVVLQLDITGKLCRFPSLSTIPNRKKKGKLCR